MKKFLSILMAFSMLLSVSVLAAPVQVEVENAVENTTEMLPENDDKATLSADVVWETDFSTDSVVDFVSKSKIVKADSTMWLSAASAADWNDTWNAVDGRYEITGNGKYPYIAFWLNNIKNNPGKYIMMFDYYVPEDSNIPNFYVSHNQNGNADSCMTLLTGSTLVKGEWTSCISTHEVTSGQTAAFYIGFNNYLAGGNGGETTVENANIYIDNLAFYYTAPGEEDLCDVYFDSNGKDGFEVTGTTEGYMPSVKLASGIEQFSTLDLSSYVAACSDSSVKFAGWSEDPNGDPVTSLQINGVTTLYAIWETDYEKIYGTELFATNLSASKYTVTGLGTSGAPYITMPDSTKIWMSGTKAFTWNDANGTIEYNWDSTNNTQWPILNFFFANTGKAEYTLKYDYYIEDASNVDAVRVFVNDKHVEDFAPVEGKWTTVAATVEADSISTFSPAITLKAAKDTKVVIDNIGLYMKEIVPEVDPYEVLYGTKVWGTEFGEDLVSYASKSNIKTTDGKTLWLSGGSADTWNDTYVAAAENLYITGSGKYPYIAFWLNNLKNDAGTYTVVMDYYIPEDSNLPNFYVSHNNFGSNDSCMKLLSGDTLVKGAWTTVTATHTVTSGQNSAFYIGFSNYLAGGNQSETLVENANICIDNIAVYYSNGNVGAPETIQGASIRTEGTQGMRFASYINDTQRAQAVEYGFIIAREGAFSDDDYTKLTFDGNTSSEYGTNAHGITFVSGKSYLTNIPGEKASIDKIYAMNGSALGLEENEGWYFTAVLYGIRKENYGEALVGRPYIKTAGGIYYGEPVVRSIKQVAESIVASQYNGNVELAPEYIQGIYNSGN